MTLGIQGIKKFSQGVKWALGIVLILMSTDAARAQENSSFSSHTRAVYNAVCATCHGTDGLGKTVGDNRFPSIAGLPTWYVKNQLILYKYDGRGAHHLDKEGLMMHAMIRALKTDKEVEEMAAYIGNTLTKKKPYQPNPKLDPKHNVSLDIENGRKIYTNPVNCIRCHGENFEGKDIDVPGEGGKILGSFKAPPLTSLEDWYMLSQLKKFMAKHRGEPAATVAGRRLKKSQADFRSPSYGPIQMQTMTLTAFAAQQDKEQAMKDVVAYIYKTAEEERIRAEKEAAKKLQKDKK